MVPADISGTEAYPVERQDPTNARAGMRVLVAEDEPAIRLMLVVKLRQAGYVATGVEDGAEALEAARRERPDLVITDHQMPRLDGLSMARALRADAALAETPVILMSSRGCRIAGGEVGDTNVQHLLMKPFSMREVLAIVQEYRDRLEPLSGAAA